MSYDRDKKVMRVYAENPEPGDYWNECLSPICVVIEVAGENIRVCRKTMPVDDDHWTWDLRDTEVAQKSWLIQHAESGDRCLPNAHSWAASPMSFCLLTKR